MKQRLVWILLIVAWALQSFVAAAMDEAVPDARDLQHDAGLAQQKNGIVLVMFYNEFCGYCAQVLNEFLIPMSRNPDYQRKLVMRRVDNASDAPLKGFDGRMRTHRQFTRDLRVRLVPTVMLFDTRGRPLGKPLIGITTVDYYGFYLDEAIDQGLAMVRSGKAANGQ
ncbi:MAG TPA: thioredoxin fold domain-containing protein [Thiobacillaceae bacterium]|nr:thioredoxin fold domain-containing protein [Thiobacillaceae bacterium]HNU64867.1 thioredoxin fold domain-containing protein [Thiobacillaceae bacterium]